MTDYDIEILGAVYGNQNIIDDYKINNTFFMSGKYKGMFDILYGIHTQGKEITDNIIMAEIRDTDYSIGDFVDLPATQHNIEYYIDHQKEILTRERLRKLTLILQGKVKDSEIDDIIDYIERYLTRLHFANGNNIKKLSECVHDVIQRVEQYYKTKGAISGLTCGYPAIDAITNGLQDGELIIIGARPSMGKTALALCMLSRMAAKNIPCGFFTCEMSEALITERLLTAEAKISMSEMRSGRLKPSDFHNITEAAGKMYNKDIWIDDTPNIELSTLKSQARVMARKGVRCIFVDYMTLIKYKANIPKHEKVGEISKAMKHLARELRMPIVVLSQIRRDKEGKRPNMSDLRWSGEIEEDADVIMMIHRARGESETELLIEKNKNGPTDSVPLHYIQEFMTFEEVAYE